MAAKHRQPNRVHASGNGSLKTLFEIYDLALVERMKLCQKLVGCLRLRQ